jgi:hypothetical protein
VGRASPGRFQVSAWGLKKGRFLAVQVLIGSVISGCRRFSARRFARTTSGRGHTLGEYYTLGCLSMSEGSDTVVSICSNLQSNFLLILLFIFVHFAQLLVNFVF